MTKLLILISEFQKKGSSVCSLESSPSAWASELENQDFKRE